ncbi:MbtH family NRPS accessory protein [Nocardia pseudobrasiliensis]|uniref:MbtH family NRPS accessory protein n=1 Tax=Nocardia pseudobrasiliensis TaxID=45979 RepID=UPI0009EDFB08|nr:MbtH family NRPS accessory protein [Nocardia pseudobrasiliensis]
MGSPVDDDARQHSLWPIFAAIPSGWIIVHGARMRAQRLDFVAARRPDPHPAAILSSF